MGVEIHLGAMVTGFGDDDVEVTKSDGTHVRVPAATKVWAAGTRASPLGATVASSHRGGVGSLRARAGGARLLGARVSRNLRRGRPHGPR